MKDLMKQFKEVRKNFFNTLEKFPKSKVNEILFGEWSLKDAVAHFIGWDEYFITALKLLKQGKPVPHWGNMNEFNAKSVIKGKKLTWEEVYKKFSKSGQEFIKEFDGMSKETQKKLFWKNKKYTPFKFLKINIHHYQKSHLLKIKKLLEEWRGK